ncbi:MAG: HAMP domain-containing sensor histidine kinase [bacterium]
MTKREKELDRIAKLLIRRDLALTEANERLMAMDIAKSEFIAIAAHQLRTPLSGVKWTLKMLIDGDIGSITNEQKEFLKRAYETNERMIYLVNDLLDVAHIEEGHFIYEPQACQLEDLIKETIAGFQKDLMAKQINLEIKQQNKNLPKVQIDLEKIRLVLQNLLENAIHYTPIKGKIKVCLEQINDNLKVSIKDNGFGVPKEQQTRIFSKFFRGRNVIKKDTSGTGLGLYIAKNIVEAHNGQIGFESEENNGSVFWFELPLR